ncbi:hypothetical protein EYY98_13115 [Obesumbacterium proteus]|nr:hypothetical protein EYY98_13115 [Obesumbacterium proteus]
MALPARASADYILRFGDLLDTGGKIDEISYHLVMKNFQYSHEANDVSAVGFAYALNGEDENATKHFLANLNQGSLLIAGNFAAFLHKRWHFNQLLEVIFDLSNDYGGKMLTLMAALEAYRVGRIDMIEMHMTKHINLLGDENRRHEAEEYMHELIADVRSCYEEKLCTPNHFEMIGKITHDILEKHRLTPGGIGVFSDFSGDYAVQVQKATPDIIARLNYELAERICEIADLDDCEMTARFTMQRKSHKEFTYDHKEY